VVLELAVSPDTPPGRGGGGRGALATRRRRKDIIIIYIEGRGQKFNFSCGTWLS
jgi:hypothetical protein